MLNGSEPTHTPTCVCVGNSNDRMPRLGRSCAITEIYMLAKTPVGMRIGSRCNAHTYKDLALAAEFIMG